MPVETFHPLYTHHQAQSQRTRDAVAGADAVKAKGTEYLPHPQGSLSGLDSQEQAEAEERYRAYKKRALWLGVTGRTHDGMLGAVYRKDPQIDLPDIISYLEEDADGNGLTLFQYARGVTSSQLQEGRHGILVDYPEAEDGLTVEQTQGLRAVLRSYSDPHIINWRRNGDKLALVVLREVYEISDDEFAHDLEWQYRVLSLDDQGLYVQRVFRGGAEVSRAEPRKADGSRWEEIPFQFVGTKNNDEYPDKPLLLDMADVNFAHYRNSADLEEGAFIAAQPMVHVDVGDMTTEQWKDLNPNGITVGARRGVQTKGGSMNMVQAEARNLNLKLMEQKEEQMLAIGARLIQQRGQNQTAEEVRAKSGTENASLSTVSHNGSDGIRQALIWVSQFMTRQDLADQIVFVLNQEFYPEDADPQLITARIQELDRGLIAKKDYRDWRRKTGGIDPQRTDEDIDDEIQVGGAEL